MSRPPERLAALDVGSNTILLLIAEYSPTTGLSILEDAEDQPRLAAGLAQTGRLSDEAMERAVQSLIRMRDLCRRHRVDRIRAVATAAVREAENGEEFVQRVRELGIPLRIISAEAEAALAYRSAAHHFPGRERLLVADIGGGSLELVGAAEGRMTLSLSLPLGVVRMTELRLPLPNLRQHIRERLAAAIPEEWAGSSVIGSGGTFATLGGIVLGREQVSAGSIHGIEVLSEEVEALLAALSTMSPEALRKLPGLKPERADIIVAGLAVIAELLVRVKATAVTVSGYGLRDGLLLEMVDDENDTRASKH